MVGFKSAKKNLLGKIGDIDITKNQYFLKSNNRFNTELKIEIDNIFDNINSNLQSKFGIEKDLFKKTISENKEFKSRIKPLFNDNNSLSNNGYSTVKLIDNKSKVCYDVEEEIR